MSLPPNPNHQTYRSHTEQNPLNNNHQNNSNNLNNLQIQVDNSSTHETLNDNNEDYNFNLPPNLNHTQQPPSQRNLRNVQRQKRIQSDQGSAPLPSRLQRSPSDESRRKRMRMERLHTRDQKLARNGSIGSGCTLPSDDRHVV